MNSCGGVDLWQSFVRFTLSRKRKSKFSRPNVRFWLRVHGQVVAWRIDAFFPESVFESPWPGIPTSDDLKNASTWSWKIIKASIKMKRAQSRGRIRAAAPNRSTALRPGLCALHPGLWSQKRPDLRFLITYDRSCACKAFLRWFPHYSILYPIPSII